MHLRIARPVKDLDLTACKYRSGLGLQEIGRFTDHEGFDGIMLGFPLSNYHLEFTVCRSRPLKASPTPDDLLVFYVPEVGEWSSKCQSMRDAGFKEVQSLNPYWGQCGSTFEDDDGYRVVIQRATWSNR